MRYLDSDAPKEKQEFSSAFDELKSLLADRYISVNSSFFDVYPNVDEYWEALDHERAEDTPVIYNGYDDSSEYGHRLFLLAEEIINDFKKSINKFHVLSEKIFYIESQKYYFLSAIEELKPVMNKVQVSQSSKSVILSDQFKFNLPAEVIHYYLIDEDFQFHIEEQCPLWFLSYESSYLSRILDFLDKEKTRLMLLMLTEISNPESLQQLKNQNSINCDKDPDGSVSNKIVEQPMLILPENFSLPKMHLVAKRLDIRQTALLFEYLKQFNVILNYHPDSLASIVSALTGHSKQNLRADEGFGMVGFIKQDLHSTKLKKLKSVPNHNLNVLKALLVEIIEELDKQMNENLKRNIT